jgi:DNA-binding NtrC family response regulator
VNVLYLSPASQEQVHIAGMITDAGHLAIAAETSVQAVARLVRSGADLVLLDLAGGGEALKFLRRRADNAPPPVVCIADRRRPASASEALRLGVADIVGRPVRSTDLLNAFANAREFARLVERQAPGSDVPDPPDGIFAASPAMREVVGIVRRVSQSRCGVLLVGERGSGRETIARAIHAQSPQNVGAFTKFACGDIDVPSFGAALEGAAFRNATIYLEDLGALAPELQERLELRIADTRDDAARVIGSAQPDIVEAVDRGAFRRTLFETIGLVRIDLPPLRQRTHDIPLLAMFFLKEACLRQDVPAKTLSRGALSLLSTLPWHGNAGELRALMARLAILIPRGVVVLEDVLPNIRLGGADAIGAPRGSLKTARESFERDYITAVLQHHKGRMTSAARELGIERTNLYRKMKQLNIHTVD